MAKTKLRGTDVERIRQKIRVNQLVNLLRKHALGQPYRKPGPNEKCEVVADISPSRIRAAEVLLRKVLPDLSATEISGQLTTYAADLQAIADARAAAAMPASSDAVQQQPAESPAPLPPVVH